MLEEYINQKVNVVGWEGEFTIIKFSKTDDIALAILKKNLEEKVEFPVNVKVLKKDGKFLIDT